MLRLVAVQKRYGLVEALFPTDLTIDPGTTTILIGPSGSGKSTLLRMMAGLVKPDAGTIEFQGVPLRDDNLRSIRQKIGFVIQEGGLFPHLTARSNVTVMARYLRWPRARIDGRITELARMVQLDLESLRRYPLELSGGQRQRVSLMRALMLDPDVLLMDEPLGALDPMIRFDLQNDLRQIFQTVRKTVVMVTHDMAEAAFFADTIVLMRDGLIVQQGTLRDLVENPADPFVEKFIRAQRCLPVEAGKVA